MLEELVSYSGAVLRGSGINTLGGLKKSFFEFSVKILG